MLSKSDTRALMGLADSFAIYRGQISDTLSNIDKLLFFIKGHTNDKKAITVCNNILKNHFDTGNAYERRLDQFNDKLN